jgi:hypothetical protein
MLILCAGARPSAVARNLWESLATCGAAFVACWDARGASPLEGDTWMVGPVGSAARSYQGGEEVFR